MCLTQNKPIKMLKCKYHTILKNKYFFEFNYIELINNKPSSCCR